MNATTDARVNSTPQPWLSIAHLLIWTALAGLLMCWMTWVAKSAGARGNDNATLPLTFRTFAAMTGGASVGGLFLAAAWRRRGIRFPVTPGEWILVSQGISIAMAVPIECCWTHWAGVLTLATNIGIQLLRVGMSRSSLPL